MMSSWVMKITILLVTTCAGVAGQDTVTQKDRFAIVKEGEPVQIHCSYTGTLYSMHWYKQYPSGQLEFMATLSATKTVSKDHFDMSLDTQEKNTSILLRRSQLEDSAVYFCAPSYTGNAWQVIFGTGTQLFVIPDITESEPSVYELEPADKNKQLSACLFTDYFPDEIKVSSDGSEPVKRNSSVVVVEDEASYGTVLWQESRDDFQCAAVYQEQKYLVLAKNGTADVCSETQMRFETDERLNLLSLTVLGLRVIFFKSVALNLLLTFRLWSH